VKALYSTSKACPRIYAHKSSLNDALNRFIYQHPVRCRSFIAAATAVWRDRVRQASGELKGSTLGSRTDACPADGKVFAVAAENANEMSLEPT